MTGHRPDARAYEDLAADHVLVPVVREVLADVSTPVSVYGRLRGPGSFLLESVEQGERWGRYSFIGVSPLIELRARDGRIDLRGDVPSTVARAADTGDPLATVQALLDWLTVPDLPDLPPLFAGLVGYLGWDVVRFLEDIPDDTTDDLVLDDARLVLPGQVVAFDHLRQRLVVVTNTFPGDDPAGAYDAAVSASQRLIASLAEPVAAPVIPPPRPTTVTDAKANMAPGDYMASVETAKAYIRAGDAFQVVPSQRFALDTTVDPLAVHRVLRVINPSPYMYLFDYGDIQIVGSSPEALVTVAAGQAQIWPIAGSQPRGETPEEDLEREQRLLDDQKERAEHVMLVDLARNDLGRISEIGSVTVEDFMSVVRYSHIMHLVSRVEGTVREGMTAVDVIRASFPAGTLSGAPKVRAMAIIDELEPTRRGVYGGGIGYVDLRGNADLCIAIRTLVFHRGCAYVQAGAGIVADSVPQTEYEETRNKAMALLSAVRAAEEWEAATP